MIKYHKYMLPALMALSMSVFSVKADTIEKVDFFEAGGNYYCYSRLEQTPRAQTLPPEGYELLS